MRGTSGYQVLNLTDLQVPLLLLPVRHIWQKYHRLEHNGDMATYEPFNTSISLSLQPGRALMTSHVFQLLDITTLID